MTLVRAELFDKANKPARGYLIIWGFTHFDSNGILVASKIKVDLDSLGKASIDLLPGPARVVFKIRRANYSDFPYFFVVPDTATAELGELVEANEPLPEGVREYVAKFAGLSGTITAQQAADALQPYLSSASASWPVAGTPSTFPPQSHTHPYAALTGVPTSFAPKQADKGTWQPNTSYDTGDVVTFVGRRWSRTAAGTSGTTFNPTNWILLGKLDESYTMLPAGQLFPSAHIRNATVSLASLAQNAARGVRFGIGRSTIITSVNIEITTVGSNLAGVYEVNRHSFDRTTGILGSGTTLGTILLDSVGIKTLVVNESVTAGTDIVISVVAKSTGVPTIKMTSVSDPALYDTQDPTLSGYHGWTGTNAAGQKTTAVIPMIYLTAAA